MTDYSNYTNKYIENKIGLNLKTLNNISIGEFDKKYSDIYSLTGHEYRYSALSTVLKILSAPLAVVSNAIKILSCGVVAVKEMVNIPLSFLNKMDQGISKKILQGLQDTNEEELSDITNNILEQWKEDNTLILQEEDSVFTRFKNYVCENVPFIESIRNFWVNGGIHYTKEQLEEQHLVKQITKEIFKLGYIAGKKGVSLNKEDIYKHLLEQQAYNVGIKDSVAVTAESKQIMINADEEKQEISLASEALCIKEDKNIEQVVYNNEFLQQLGLLYLKSKFNWMVCNTNSNNANICNALQELLLKVDASYGYNNIDLMGDNSTSYNQQFELKDYSYNMVSCAA